MGIEPRRLASIFGAFSPIAAAYGDWRRTGPPAITRAIVEGHGGEIRARATEGLRSVFRISLPASAGGSSASAAPRATSVSVRGKTIPSGGRSRYSRRVLSRALPGEDCA
jgi:hypothetical protein